MKIEFPNEENTNVISITIASNYRRQDTKCSHSRVIVDEELAQLECETCGKEINPIHYLAFLASEWHQVEDLRKRQEAACKLYESKTRTKCEHCQQMTKIRSPKDFERNFRLLTENSCP